MKASFTLIPLLAFFAAASPTSISARGNVCRYGSNQGLCQASCSGSVITGTYKAGDWPCGSGLKCCGSGAAKPASKPAPTKSSSGTSKSGTAGGHTPDNAIALIKEVEGFVGTFYPDQDGLQTIGYGHACIGTACSGIKSPLTEAQATDLLKKDLPTYEKTVCSLPNAASLNANQFGALVSFCFNDGQQGTIAAWTAKMKAKDFNGIAAAFPSTDTDNGVRTTRRTKEQALFRTATSVKSGC